MADTNSGIIAVSIKKLWYGDTTTFSADVTGSTLATALSKMTSIGNVHQETWQLEQTESSVTGYKNQLTGKLYRQDTEEGEVSINFTIGQYDYELKAALLGGSATETSWKRSREKVVIEKAFVALTDDDQYVAFPRMNVVGREATGDKAVQLPIKATMLEPENEAISAEYWFDSSEVKTA